MRNNEINKQRYFVNLDAMRFYAAVAVLLFHYFSFLEQNDLFSNALNYLKPLVSKGHLGVNFFFVLSAFLISLLVFREIEKNGNFSIRYFLIRRTLRIWPLYFVVVGLSFWLVDQFPIYGETKHDPIWFVFFLSNLGEIQNGLGDAYTQLTIPWSVSIEEQFYLFWAFIIGGFSIKRKQSFLLFFGFLLLTSLGFQLLYYNEERILYYHTIPALTDLSIGALTAYLFHFNFHKLVKYISFTKWKVYLIYFLITLLILLKNKVFHYGYFIVIERLFIAIAFAWIILHQIISSKSIKCKSRRLFTHFGKVSYGIYMYHCMTLFGVEVLFFHYELGPQVIWLLLLASLATLIVSHLSYTYFESYFLRLKESFSKTY